MQLLLFSLLRPGKNFFIQARISHRPGETARERSEEIATGRGSQRTVQATEESVKEEAGSLSVRKDEKKGQEPDKNKTR